MCLVAWRWSPEQADSFVLISNRDEFYERPTEPAHRWQSSNIWAGKDNEAGGTWLGVTDSGRFAAITNHRSAIDMPNCSTSRGNLVTQFLNSQQSSQTFMKDLVREFETYKPFNLMVFDGKDLLGFEGRTSSYRLVNIEPGFGAVSNADFNSPWFKQIMLQDKLQQVLKADSCADDELLDLLLSDELAPVDQLPQTGVPFEAELALSAAFVRMASYGTRASSLVRMRDQEIVFAERTFMSGSETQQVQHVISQVATQT